MQCLLLRLPYHYHNKIFHRPEKTAWTRTVRTQLSVPRMRTMAITMSHPYNRRPHHTCQIDHLNRRHHLRKKKLESTTTISKPAKSRTSRMQDSQSEPRQRKRSAGHGSQRFKNKGQKSDVVATTGVGRQAWLSWRRALHYIQRGEKPPWRQPQVRPEHHGMLEALRNAQNYIRDADGKVIPKIPTPSTRPTATISSQPTSSPQDSVASNFPLDSHSILSTRGPADGSWRGVVWKPAMG